MAPSASFFRRFYFFSMGMIATALLNGSFRGPTSIRQLDELLSARKRLHASIAQLESEIITIETELERVRHSPAYALKTLKDKYNVWEQGERVIYLSE